MDPNSLTNALNAMAAHVEASFSAPVLRMAPLPPNTFSAVSLEAWLSHADAAGVPAVPAQVIGRFPFEQWLRAAGGPSGDPEAADRLAASLVDIVGRRRPGHILRWDPCAPEGIKHAMGLGRRDLPEDRDLDLYLEDCRAFDILMEYPGAEVPILERPWIPARGWNGYPVEFRVMIQEGQAVAVSNYYVQRALPESPEVLAWAALCLQHARTLVAHIQAQGLFPWMAMLTNTPEQEAIQGRFEATLDFLVTEAGDVCFLEAGPGVGWGAHPCCFYDGGTVHPIKGLRLSAEGPTLPLPLAEGT